MEKEEKLKFISYSRKSQDREDRQMLSIESQEREIKNIISRYDIDLDFSFSESKSAYVIGRGKFNEMYNLIEKGKVNGIVCWHLNRLARNAFDGGRLIYLMDIGLLKKIITNDGVYENTSNDKFMMQMHFAMAKKSSDDSSDFIKNNFKTKILRGEYPGYSTIGYLNISKNGTISGKQYSPEKQKEIEEISKRKLRRIEKDPFQNYIILKLFGLCSLGDYSLSMLCKEAEKLGIKGKRNNKKINKETMRGILTNPFYYGAIRYQDKLFEPWDFDENIRNNYLHEPTISKALFDRVQEVLGLKTKPIERKHYYPFSSFIKCGKCSKNTYSGIVAKGHTYYRCANCGGEYIPEEKLENQINELINTIEIGDEDFLKLALDELSIRNKEEINKRDNIIKNYQNEIKNCQIRIDNLLQSFTCKENFDYKIFTPEEFARLKSEALKEKENLQEKLKDAEENSSKWFNTCVDYFNFMIAFKNKFNNGSPEQKRTLFQYISYNPIITDKILLTVADNPNNLLIELKDEFKQIITTNNSENKIKKDILQCKTSTWCG